MSYRNDILNVVNLNLPWEKLEGCNVLVTGATGLIGSCLIESLIAHPNVSWNVYACGRNEERARKRFSDIWNDKHFHFVKHDVTQPVSLDIPFDYIIHAASNGSPSFFANTPVEVMKANLFGTCHLLDYGLENGLKRFLMVSSGEIYGEGDGRTFTEDYSGYVNPMIPRSCYPSSKRASETICASYMDEYGVDIVVARPCHIYGPNFTESDNRVYAQFIRNVINNEDIVMKSTGEQYRSWCYVVDCVSALLYILLKGQPGEAYNIADENSNISIKELAEMIAGIGGRKVIINIPTDSEKAGYNIVKKSVFDTSKLKSLGWFVTDNMGVKICSTIEEARQFLAL